MTARAPRTPRRPPIKILLVDDDPLICSLGRELLENLGYRVEVATAGPEALRRFRKKGRTDLVILDYYLPGENGPEILEQLKNLDPEVRVLLASGFLTHGEADHLLRIGVSGLIQKPFRVGELDTQIKRALAGQSGL